MRRETYLVLLSIVTLFLFRACSGNKNEHSRKDWLLNSEGFISSVTESPDKKDIILENGLVRRTFRITPGVACWDYYNMSNGDQIIRAIEPEARIIIDGREYLVGGLKGHKERAFLKTGLIDSLPESYGDFAFRSYEIRPVKQLFEYKQRFWSSNNRIPEGKGISFHYDAVNDTIKGIKVQIHYDIFDGVPVIRKWLTVTSERPENMKINQVVHEILSVPEEKLTRMGNPEKFRPYNGLYVETNYAFNNSMTFEFSDFSSHWIYDKDYYSASSAYPVKLEIYPQRGPGIILEKGDEFTSLQTYELLVDSYDRERRGMAIRRMYRMLLPWTNENPIFMHIVSKNDDQVRTVIDQCAKTGYEAVIVSFGSHLNMEDNSPENISRWKSLADYAHSKNIGIGGYSLFSSRRIDDETDVVDPLTGKPGGALYGNAPCFGSKWGLEYRDKIQNFLEQTGFDLFEHDGPYPGDACASTSHPGHSGLDDSQWRQFQIQKDLYRWCCSNGIYVNAPDWYIADGTHKVCIGYNEGNYKLPMDEQIVINRQNIYDALWEKTSSMNWGFVPLTSYAGGKKNAILEPLSEHLDDYVQYMIQHYGSGVQACYRGFRLYDNDSTKQAVISTINWYKKYRDVLNGDLLHLRRADGRNWDGWMMVNPHSVVKGVVILFNPLKKSLSQTITLPLYYTGLTLTAVVREKEGKKGKVRLNRDYTINLPVELPAESYTWFTIE